MQLESLCSKPWVRQQGCFNSGQKHLNLLPVHKVVCVDSKNNLSLQKGPNFPWEINPSRWKRLVSEMSAPSINNAGGHPLSAFGKLKVCPAPHLHTHSFNEHCHRYKKNDKHDMGIHQVFEYTVWWHVCYLDSLAANCVIYLGGLLCQVHISHQEKCKHVSNFLHELESRHRLSYALRLWKILFFFSFLPSSFPPTHRADK